MSDSQMRRLPIYITIGSSGVPSCIGILEGDSPQAMNKAMSQLLKDAADVFDLANEKLLNASEEEFEQYMADRRTEQARRQ